MARSQALPSLGTSSFEYRPASLGTHSLAKPVGLGAASIVWLESSLHSQSPFRCLRFLGLPGILSTGELLIDPGSSRCENTQALTKPERYGKDGE